MHALIPLGVVAVRPADTGILFARRMVGLDCIRGQRIRPIQETLNLYRQHSTQVMGLSQIENRKDGAIYADPTVVDGTSSDPEHSRPRAYPETR